MQKIVNGYQKLRNSQLTIVIICKKACFKIVFDLKLRKNKSYAKPEDIELWN